MRSRTGTGWGIALAALGVLSLAAAAILAWVVVPDRKQLPADTDTSRQFSGTAKLLLNPQALATGDLRSAVLINVPVTAQRTVKATATEGEAAEVSDTRVLSTGTGAQVGRTEATYAVDRKSLEAASDPPSSWQVVPHEGLTVSWPIGAKKQDYTAWVNETKSTTTARFVREENKGGVDTYVYEADVATAPVKDEQVLGALPKGLPVSAVTALASALPLPPDAKALLAQALPALPDPVPLNYTYEAKSTFWVEPTTGLVVDTERAEIRKAGMVLRTGGALPGIPVYDVATNFTEQSVNEAAADANDAKNSIDLYSTTLPLILLGVGLVALVAGVALLLAGRRAAGTGGEGPGSASPAGPSP